MKYIRRTLLLLLPALAILVADLEAQSKFAIPATDEGLPGAGPIRRYGWFKNLWERKRSGWAKRGKQDQGALVFLGDSITQGWGDSMGGSFPGVKVANRGISGDTTRGVLIRLKEDVLSLKPTGIVLLIGTNDLCATCGIPGQLEHDRIVDAYAKVIAACNKAGSYPGMGGVYKNDLMEKYLSMGIRVAQAGSDTALLIQAGKERIEFLNSLDR